MEHIYYIATEKHKTHLKTQIILMYKTTGPFLQVFCEIFKVENSLHDNNLKLT